MSEHASSLRQLSREQLAVLVPELMLAGHLIDRAGLPHALVAFGPDGMRDVAIEEWIGASPVYTKRMQRALGFEGDDVPTLFKGLQLDIGAPPQFMDFRFTVHDRWHGEFALAHCGALMDVEPLGEGFVVRMCHDIEDPTFEATAIATNPRAQVRPIHRPPRVPVDRSPHCAWSASIEPDHPAVAMPAQAGVIARTAAALITLSAIDPDEDGLADYTGPLLSDLSFADFSHSALVRIAEELCVQGHLLVLAFRLAVQARGGEVQAREMAGKQFTGIAGLVAARLRAALGLPATLDGLATLLAIHPALNPPGYVRATVQTDRDTLVLELDRHCPAVADTAWPALLDEHHIDPIQAICNAVDPYLSVSVRREDADALTLQVHRGEVTHPDFGEVQVTRLSTGAAFRFDDRGRGLPLVGH